MPGEETAPDIISDIMESNGFKGVTEDLIFSTETPKLVTVHNAIKDFFDKKISEESFNELLKNKLKISEENAIKIIKEVKDKILPYAKKIRTENTAEIPTTSETSVQLAQEQTKMSPQPAEINKIIKNTKLPKIVHKDTEIREAKKTARMGSDKYREPIE